MADSKYKPHPKPLPELTDSDLARFFSKVPAGLPSNICWEWLGSRDTKRGYGIFHTWKKLVPKGRILRPIRASRVMYFLHYRKDPGHLLVLHSCDHPPCVNPAHLFLGDVQDNSDDMVAKGRADRGEARYNAKLTEDLVMELRNRLAIGETGYTILPDMRRRGLPVNREALHRIRHGLAWKHVTGKTSLLIQS